MLLYGGEKDTKTGLQAVEMKFRKKVVEMRRIHKRKNESIRKELGRINEKRFRG